MQENTPTNAARAEMAYRTLLVYQQWKESSGAPSGDPEAALVDLLTDLMHWAQEHGANFQEAGNLAFQHYAAEAPEAEAVSPAPTKPVRMLAVVRGGNLEEVRSDPLPDGLTVDVQLLDYDNLGGGSDDNIVAMERLKRLLPQQVF